MHTKYGVAPALIKNPNPKCQFPDPDESAGAHKHLCVLPGLPGNGNLIHIRVLTFHWENAITVRKKSLPARDLIYRVPI